MKKKKKDTENTAGHVLPFMAAVYHFQVMITSSRMESHKAQTPPSLHSKLL